MASGSSGRYAALIKVIMMSESLDELPEVHPDPERTSFVSRILKAESLPLDEAESGGERPTRSAGLFASEALPLDDRPAARNARPTFFSTLFSRESLPVDPVPQPGRTGRSPGR